MPQVEVAVEQVDEVHQVVVQAAGGAPTLVEGLTARGWAVTRLDTHVSRPLPLPRTAAEESMRRSRHTVFEAAVALHLSEAKALEERQAQEREAVVQGAA